MQIHEITTTQLDEGVGSFLGGLAGGVSNFANKVGGVISPVDSAKNAYTSAVRPQQIKMLANKVYNGWKQYEKTLLQSNPDARETGMYEQALTAFVVKNLLGNQYLPNVINQEQIKKLVKQLSGSSGVTEVANPKVTGAAGSGRATVADNETLNQKIAAAGAAAAPKTPGTPPPETPTPPKPPAAPAAPLTPQKEKDLWLQLTQQAAVATAHAPGTSGKPDDSKTSNDTGPSEAKSFEDQLRSTATDPAVVKFLNTVANSAKGTGNNTAKPTGNSVADALLMIAGFRGLQ